ncbi:glutathione S-transferase, amine-terminal domain protein (macronuclear) [Tetrahymena thermophila SB210]|uniref:glutathione transferase n=1 Tax=Tetrahymena thermophila (strain SB210) TaxID=312017 RepID=I7MKR4_TETTS|nr:glutathione S-transferase, amine-terminal domain protein [Tetrahymena thermophila SB210]EAR99882.2 glutathione S-transferase, amine-terminal domain protein [Tetrahymena thermophila SB210]|eukprot:XP_001020127.2 glutathione S-transferase, amine-terminal domain protein [Tetrahymena thermophila SB210]
MITLGYWGVRGLGESVRYLLAYLNVDYKHQAYYNPQDWFAKDKAQLKIEFSNLPYLIDGEQKITDSYAISIYIIRKYHREDLLGYSEDGSYNEREVKIAQLIGVTRDIFQQIVHICFSPQFDKIKDQAFEKGQIFLNQLTDFLGDKQFLLGHLSLADFLFYEALTYYQVLHSQSITQRHEEYMHQFESLPGIKQYLNYASKNFNSFLLNLKQQQQQQQQKISL